MPSFEALRKTLKNPEFVWDYLRRKSKLIGVRKHQQYKRFIILARSRTGSNLLISYLNHHTHIIAQTELFQNASRDSFESVLNDIFKSYPIPIKAVGFKIFYYHPINGDGTALWEKLVAMKDLHVIHLKRRNILRTMISRKIAAQKDSWTAFEAKDQAGQATKRVTFTPAELTEGFEQTRSWEEEGERMFKEHPLLTLYYEDLAESPEKIFQNITEFLGLDYQTPKTFFQKQNPEKTSDLLGNYIDLKDHFAETPWSSFFND